MSADGHRDIDRKFDIGEVAEAEDLIIDFEERAAQVAIIMFSGRYKIRSTGSADVFKDRNEVVLRYWDGYDAEPFDNCSMTFPFDWLNKTDEELNAMYKPYWDERDEIARKYKEEQKRKEAEEEEAKQRVRESNEFQEYLKLKKQYEKYEN